MKFPNLRIGIPNGLAHFTDGQPVVQRIDARRFRLRAPYMAKWTGGRLDVPDGFQCDLASIPRVFHVLLPKGGLHDGPSVVHDAAYERHWRTRKDSDDLFLACLKVAGVGWFRRHLMYVAVRSAGWYLWNRHGDEQ